MDGEHRIIQVDPQGLGRRQVRGTPSRKRGAACNRCRAQKVRCDGQRPACTNCVKAGVKCIRAQGPAENAISSQYIQRLERRTRWLEDVLKSVRPDIPLDGQENDVPYEHPPAANSPAVSTSSQISPTQPLAHEVGLLSLGNSLDPKYLGPSSGVPFARLIFAAAPQTQGLSTMLSDAGQPHTSSGEKDPASAFTLARLPKEDETQYFVDAYFETWHPFYPFLNPESFHDLLEECYKHEVTNIHGQRFGPRQLDNMSKPIDLAQVFLVLALGSKILEYKLGKDFNSDHYHTTAIYHIGRTQLHDSVAGVQVLLLLLLSSFSFTSGLNAWFLSSTIMASCVDLGLQRKQMIRFTNDISEQEREKLRQLQNLRSGIFWSAYSMDRTLCVILGRPLTLRDEAIDNGFPGEHDSHEIDQNAVRHYQPRLEMESDQSPYVSANYSFRFDRINAEIKLMIYRVAQSPARFPWPTNLPEWQQQTQEACAAILNEARYTLRRRGNYGKSRVSDGIVQSLELKYHQCLMLLFRPSPALPQPTFVALNTCFESAIETIRIYSDLDRFGRLINSWHNAHAVFISAITILYCIWTSPKIRHETFSKAFLSYTDTSTQLLKRLGMTWSVAEDARKKFERLVQLTMENWKQTKSGCVTPAQPNIYPPPADVDLESSKQMDFLQVPESLPLNDWDSIDIDLGQRSNIILDELGDMGNWFDLDWLGDTSSMYPCGEYDNV